MSAYAQCHICSIESKLRVLYKCKDRFCVDCWKKMTQSQLKDANPINKCSECNTNQLDYSCESAYKLFPVSLQERLRKQQPPNPCKVPNCEGRISYGLCTMCNQEHCPICENIYHQGKCADSIILPDNTKKCPNCRTRIEKTDGCNKMTCLCKHEFCFVDGEEWSYRHIPCGKDGVWRFFKGTIFQCFYS